MRHDFNSAGFASCLPDDSQEELPPEILGRASAAYREMFALWEARIDDVRADRSLTPDQRAAAVIAFRLRQRIEARAIRRRVLAEAWTLRGRPRRKFIPEPKIGDLVR